MKPGDIANIHKKLSVMSYYSKTAGAVLKRASLASKYTIHDLTAAKNISVTSAAASTHYGGEIGLVTFFPLIGPIRFTQLRLSGVSRVVSLGARTPVSAAAS